MAHAVLFRFAQPDQRLRLLAATPFGCKQIRKSGRLWPVGETGATPLRGHEGRWPRRSRRR
jgi:hypothetical protein